MAITPTGPGMMLVLLSSILISLSWVVISGRVWVRKSIRALGADDWMMVFGLIFYTLACQATITAAYNGVGTHAVHLNDYYDREGRKWFMFFQIFYVASTVPIKSAICISLLRITREPKYRYPLNAIITLATIAAITGIITVLTQCRPVAATWDKRMGTCDDPKVITNVSYFISSISIITDWTCAILPVFILWNVQLRFRIKASVAAILALGVVASTATLVRLRFLLNYNDPDDYLYGLAYIAVWSIIESGIGIIAGSLPTLRPLLRYIPFMAAAAAANVSSSDKNSSSNSTTTKSNRQSKASAYTLEEKRRSAASSAGGIRENGLRTACEAGKRHWELSDAESGKYIVKESHVSVTNEAVSLSTRYELGVGRSPSSSKEPFSPEKNAI